MLLPVLGLFSTSPSFMPVSNYAQIINGAILDPFGNTDRVLTSELLLCILCSLSPYSHESKIPFNTDSPPELRYQSPELPLAMSSAAFFCLQHRDLPCVGRVLSQGLAEHCLRSRELVLVAVLLWYSLLLDLYT